MQIEGKAAIVTGGGTGVGRATSLRLAEQALAHLDDGHAPVQVKRFL